MSKEILKYEDLVKIEKNLIKPMLENINKALKVIFEGKNVKLLGSDFDKNLYFYVDKDFKTAQWSVSEDKIKIADVKDIEIEANSINKAFTDIVVEAIDLMANEQLKEAEDRIGDAIKLKLTEKTVDKLSIFNKRPIIKEARKHLVKIGKFVSEKKDKPSLKPLVEKLQTILESFLGKSEKSEKGETFEFSILEGKAVKIEEPTVRATTLLKNVAIAKQEAQKLDLKPILENTATFISEHEELFLLKSDVIRKKLEEATKQDIAVTKEKLDETIKLFNELRSKSDSFKSIVKLIKEQGEEEEPYAGNEEVPQEKGTGEVDQELDGDGAVDALDKEEEEEKLGFMKQFVDILVEIFEKIREVSEDDGEIVSRVNNAIEIIKRNQEEGKWDKEELAEIAREAIELAAKVEGIEPEDTEVSKRAEEEEEETEMDKETISGEEGVPPQKLGEAVKKETAPAIDQPAQEIIGTYNYDEAEEPTDDVTISPDGEITYGDEEMEEIPDLDMDTFVCHDCEREFSAETGEEEYHCPYCGEMVSGELGEEPIEGPEEEEPVEEPIEEPVEEPALKDEAGPAADQPGQEVSGNVDYTKEDVEDDMKAKDKRELILGDEEEEEQKIGDDDFAGKDKKVQADFQAQDTWKKIRNKKINKIGPLDVEENKK